MKLCKKWILAAALPAPALGVDEKGSKKGQKTKRKTSKEQRRRATAARFEDLLIVDLYEGQQRVARYANNGKDYILYRYKERGWHRRRLQYGYLTLTQKADWWDCANIQGFDSESEAAVKAWTKLRESQVGRLHCWNGAGSEISWTEQKIDQDKQDRRYKAKRQKIKQQMGEIPPAPKAFYEWAMEACFGTTAYAFWNKGQEQYNCSACGAYFRGRYKHKQRITCPACGQTVEVKKRQQASLRAGRAVLVQSIDGERYAVRWFTLQQKDAYGAVRQVGAWEEMRDIFSRQTGLLRSYFGLRPCADEFEQEWWDRNPSGKRSLPGKLYIDGDFAAMTGHRYTGVEMIQQRKLDVHAGYVLTHLDRIKKQGMEYLLKRGLNHLAEELLSGWGWWTKELAPLTPENMRLLAQIDGGMRAMGWLRYAEEHHKKMPMETLLFYEQRRISVSDLSFVLPYMTPVQIANYIGRQAPDGKQTRKLLEAWSDYMSMAARLQMDPKDDIVHKPKDVFAMHDALAAEITRREKELQAEEYDRMFPGAQENLDKIRERFAYHNDTYTIVVPRNVLDIVADGAGLHHCGGASNRYIERIQQDESYILFLRHAHAPDVPYYTLEVEPAGTIRQKRSEYNRQPDLDKILPFLREWQQVVKQRIGKAEREAQRHSAELRRAAYAELRQRSERDAEFAAKMEADLMEMPDLAEDIVVRQEPDTMIFLAPGA